MFDSSGIETALSVLQYGHSTVVDAIGYDTSHHDMKIVVGGGGVRKGQNT